MQGRRLSDCRDPRDSHRPGRAARRPVRGEPTAAAKRTRSAGEPKTKGQSSMRLDRVMICLLAAATLAGCASRPVNERIAQVDPKSGYRPYLLIPKRQNNDQHTLFVLSFSGGG